MARRASPRHTLPRVRQPASRFAKVRAFPPRPLPQRIVRAYQSKARRQEYETEEDEMRRATVIMPAPGARKAQSVHERRTAEAAKPKKAKWR